MEYDIKIHIFMSTIELFYICTTTMRQRREKFLWEFVYGGIDGVITTFAVVAWATGGWLPVKVILILGFANLIADGVSMSVGNYLSTKAEYARYQKEHGKQKTDYVPPAYTALATLISFIIVWFVPLLIYVLDAIWFDFDTTTLFVRASVLTGLAFIFIGIAKTTVAKVPLLQSVLETLGLGTVAAFLAYYVGVFLEKLIAG